MEIVGSVGADEVPEGKRRFRAPGVWAKLARQAVADHMQGRVTVVKVKDEKEYQKLKNNLAGTLHAAGFTARPLVVDQGSELRVFLELAKYEPRARGNGTR